MEFSFLEGFHTKWHDILVIGKSIVFQASFQLHPAIIQIIDCKIIFICSDTIQNITKHIQFLFSQFLKSNSTYGVPTTSLVSPFELICSICSLIFALFQNSVFIVFSSLYCHMKFPFVAIKRTCSSLL